MKTFQIRISKEGKHRCLKFKSELPMESVLAAVKAIVKNTYIVSIKEIHWKVPEDRDIMWAIKEAAAVRFYHKVWKDISNVVKTETLQGVIPMPLGTVVEYNTSSNTFFNIRIPAPWCIKLNTLKAKEQYGVDIHHTAEGIHTFYMIGEYNIRCTNSDKTTYIKFYKVTTKTIITGEFVTEEL